HSHCTPVHLIFAGAYPQWGHLSSQVAQHSDRSISSGVELVCLKNVLHTQKGYLGYSLFLLLRYVSPIHTQTHSHTHTQRHKHTHTLSRCVFLTHTHTHKTHTHANPYTHSNILFLSLSHRHTHTH